MEFTLPVSIGIVAVIIALGVAALVSSGMMILETTLQMVLPSMIIFAAIMFAIGVKHGEYRATNR